MNTNWKIKKLQIIFLTLLVLGGVYLWFSLPDIGFYLRLAFLGISIVLITILGESLYKENNGKGAK